MTAPKAIVIPSWFWPIIVTLCSIVGGTLYAMNLMDARYASKSDVEAVSSKVDDTEKHVLIIENYLIRARK